MLYQPSKFKYIIKLLISKPLALGFIVFAVPVLGLALVLLGFESAFGRSGSVLVCVAILSVYVNHVLTLDVERLQSIRDATSLGKNRDEIDNNINPEITGERREAAIDSIISSNKVAKETIPKLSDAKNSLIRIEFIAGVFGTLIWGFGDLIGCVLIA